jgi:hypothetical protein
MTTAFVLGNGVSRQSIDLHQIRSHGTVYGCNALYRSYTPDVLVSTDTPISEAIQNSGYSLKNVHYTRKPLPNLGAHKIGPKYFGFSSGPVAVSLAAQAGHNRIYLLGFDLGADQFGMFNNVYAGTEYYKKASAPPTYTGNWVKQLITIANDFKTIEFVRIAGLTTAEIDKFDTVPNILHMPLEQFVDRINNTKDF